MNPRFQLLRYLEDTFGPDLLSLVREPPGVQGGERVLYRLRVPQRVRRKESTPADLRALRDQLLDIVASTGATAEVVVEPPVTSGLSVPRLVDLPGADLVWGRPLLEYYEQDTPLPSDDFPLDWALGVLFAPSHKKLFHLDFTDARVKAVFVSDYEREAEAAVGETARIRERFIAFCQRVDALREQLQGQSGATWAKIIQIDDESLREHVSVG